MDLDQTGFELIKIPWKKQVSLDQDMRCKEAIVSGLNIAGCNEIQLKGSDIVQTIDYFREKGIDLSKGLIDRRRSISENQPIKFNSNGKITIKKSMEDDPYEFVKRLL